MKKSVLLILLILGNFFVNAQSIDAILLKLTGNNAKIDTLRQLGRTLILKAKPDSAAYYYKKALEIAKSGDSKMSNRILQLHTDISRTYTIRRNPKLALEELKIAKDYISPTTDLNTLERYYFFSGYVYRLLNITDSAIYYYKKSELINNKIDPFRNWELYLGIGQLFFNNDNFRKAEEYYLKSHAITSNYNSKSAQGVVLNSLCIFYSNQNKPVEFAEYQKEYAGLIQAGNRDFSRDPIHSMLYSSWSKKPIEEQIEFLTSVKKAHLDNKFYQGAAVANKNISDLYIKSNQPEKALALLMENKEQFIDHQNYYPYYENLFQIYKVQTKAGQLSEAIKTADLLFTLNTKLSDITNRELTLDLEKKYETEKKIKEIELLNSKNKLTEVELLRQADLRLSLERENILKDETINQQLKLASLSESEKELQFKELEKERLLNSSLARENELNQKLLTNGKKRKQILWAGVLLFGIAGIIILYQYRRQLVKNKIIDKQREDLVMLNREIHHRVKNNLQVISSMLDLQSASTDDKYIAEKFQEGSQRVQSMAFIHQNLYQGENPGSIDIKEYIKMLTANLMESYNAISEKVTLTTDIEDIKLHSDTVIPIGLIINELVSNSLKYAFNNKDSGQISVVLKTLNEKLLLQVKDNGAGIPDKADVTSGPSFGYKIIKAFSQKLKAIITINNQSGTDVQLLISKFKSA